MPGEIMSAVGRTMPYTYLLSLQELLHFPSGLYFYIFFLMMVRGVFGLTALF